MHECDNSIMKKRDEISGKKCQPGFGAVAMMDYDEVDRIAYEFYRQTGKIVVDSIDSWTMAARFIKRCCRPGKGRPVNRLQLKKTGARRSMAGRITAKLAV